MSTTQTFPSFDSCLPDLHQFILELVKSYEVGKIRSWAQLEEIVKTYFTPAKMNQTETIIPGWNKMSSYAEGRTLVHVMCVFLGLYMTAEFGSMTQEQQQMMKWIVLLHDLEKEPQHGQRDHKHAFRSAVTAARILPRLGFPVTSEYDSRIDEWVAYTWSAMTKSENSLDVIQDNRKLPEILNGIEQMFGHNTAAALITKTILFHLSVDMDAWHAPSPLTEEEVIRYFDHELVPLLKAMNLGDGEGWNMFGASSQSLRNDTLEAFRKVERLLQE